MPVYLKAEVGGCGIKYTWTIGPYFTAVLVIQRRMLLLYSQGPKVIPQSLKSHRLQCIFTFARKCTVL